MATQQLTQMQALQTLGEKLDALGAAWELPDSDVRAAERGIALSPTLVFMYAFGEGACFKY